MFKLLLTAFEKRSFFIYFKTYLTGKRHLFFKGCFLLFNFQPYDQMDFSQVRCQSMLMSAIERARRQNLLNQDLFLQPS